MLRTTNDCTTSIVHDNNIVYIKDKNRVEQNGRHVHASRYKPSQTLYYNNYYACVHARMYTSYTFNMDTLCKYYETFYDRLFNLHPGRLIVH